MLFAVFLTYGREWWEDGAVNLIFIVVLVLAATLMIFMSFVTLKTKHELTPEARKEEDRKHKEWWRKFMNKWYVRHPKAILALGLAFTCYKAYEAGLTSGAAEGKGVKGFIIYFLISPAAGVLMIISAIYYAWKISLVAIASFVVFYFYL